MVKRDLRDRNFLEWVMNNPSAVDLARKGMGGLAVGHASKVVHHTIKALAPKKGQRLRTPINKTEKKNNTDNILNTNNKMSTGEEEIAVAPIPRNLSNTIPDYFTLKLKCRSKGTLTLPQGTDYTSTRITMNALNSPFAANSTFDYLGTSQWKALFQFYRIISNDITINVKNVSTTTDLASNRVDRGIVRSCIEFTDSASSRLLTSRQMVEAKHNITKVIDPPSVDHNNVQHTFKHHYEPAQFIQTNSHITNNSTEDRWTGISSNHSHPHYLHLGLTPNDTLLTVDGTIYVRYDVLLEITIQFRETTDSILTTSQTS